MIMSQFLDCVEYAQKYCEEFNQGDEEFNPYDLLLGQQTPKQEFFTECVTFLNDINVRVEEFRKEMRRICQNNVIK